MRRKGSIGSNCSNTFPKRHPVRHQFLQGFPALLIAAVVFFSAESSSRAADPKESEKTPAPIQQKAGDLLCGFSKAVAYSGFRHGQHPDRGDGAVYPSDENTLEDLQILARHGNFGLIRLYDSGKNSEDVLRIIKSHKIAMKVLLGAWLSAEIYNTNCPWLKDQLSLKVLDANRVKNRQQVESAIRLANQYPDVVVAVNVGNEALVNWTDHLVPVDSVISYVRKVKKAIKQPVTVAENYDWWVHQGTALAKELDFISVHTYPVWESKDINEGLSFTIANIQAVRNALPRSRIVITEAGWATVAREFGPRAGEEKQQRYYNELYQWTAGINITTFFFEAFDEPWKGDANDPLGAEKHWGLFTVERKAKSAMQKLYPDLAR
jgi:exo-beta-1,3-glucanase (GH17 family)